MEFLQALHFIYHILHLHTERSLQKHFAHVSGPNEWILSHFLNEIMNFFSTRGSWRLVTSVIVRYLPTKFDGFLSGVGNIP